ncbi:Ger(x)C family spore germination protein [Paenibacillus sp. DYY-L-2]|uniref:Ger(x)C family spore germination protein n=1 Tax=Paenibacillus sp. DYY-L-2 TaxID=3447013 RepID=UPI003F506DE5
MRRTGLGCLAAVFICLLTSGCWNRTELDELGITSATGFDRQNGKWVLSYQLIVPSTMGAIQGGGGGGGGSNPNVHTFTSEGHTIREAADFSYVENPRRLYFAHTDVMVIGKEAAEYGLMEILDLYFRNNDARETVLVTLTDGTAKEILRKLIPPEKMPGAALADILSKESKFSSTFPMIKVYQLAQKITSDAGAAGVPVVGFTGKSGEMENTDDQKKTFSQEEIKLMRLAVIKKDRLAGWIGRDESLGISWLTDKVKGSTISFRCQEKDSPKQSTFRVTQSKTKLSITKERDHYKAIVNVKVKGQLLEYNCEGDLSKPETIRSIEQSIAEEISGLINNGWAASQRMGADLAGFADMVHRKYPKDWRGIEKDWPELFSQMKLEITISVSVKRPGLLNKSFEHLSKNH